MRINLDKVVIERLQSVQVIMERESKQNRQFTLNDVINKLIDIFL